MDYRSGLLVLAAAASLLGGCATSSGSASGATFVPVQIRSNSATQFYYTRLDTFNTAGSTVEARRAAMVTRLGFGPLNLPATLQLMEGMAYYVIPHCGGTIGWDRGVRQPISLGSIISLTCGDAPR